MPRAAAVVARRSSQVTPEPSPRHPPSPGGALLPSPDPLLGPSVTHGPHGPNSPSSRLAGEARGSPRAASASWPGGGTGRETRAAVEPLQPAEARPGPGALLPAWLPSSDRAFGASSHAFVPSRSLRRERGYCPAVRLQRQRSQKPGGSLGEGRGKETKGEVRPLFLSSWHEAAGRQSPVRCRGGIAGGRTDGRGRQLQTRPGENGQQKYANCSFLFAT